MARPIGGDRKPVGGRDSMSYKDHLKKAFKRGSINGGYSEADFFNKDGYLKNKTISKYDF